ncbi:hypothetical protein FQR65_LT06853 [Abscondita terminalis]|nr:hypothetical protein FQR65_LT06853 [Abscondita terminalis]
MGGWPVLMGQNWNEKNFEMIHVLEKLKTLGLRNDMMLLAYVEEKPPERNINVYSPSFFSTQNVHVYKRAMIDRVIALGAEESVANEDMSETFDFIFTITNVLFALR